MLFLTVRKAIEVVFRASSKQNLWRFLSFITDRTNAFYLKILLKPNFIVLLESIETLYSLSTTFTHRVLEMIQIEVINVMLKTEIVLTTFSTIQFFLVNNSKARLFTRETRVNFIQWSFLLANRCFLPYLVIFTNSKSLVLYLFKFRIKLYFFRIITRLSLKT
jgi:hypothetical protein